MSDTNEHSLSLSYQIRRAIKAEDALHVAKQEIANLNELLNAAYVDKTAQQAQPERAPLSEKQCKALWHGTYEAHSKWSAYDWFSHGITRAEQHHGIKQGGQHD